MAAVLLALMVLPVWQVGSILAQDTPDSSQAALTLSAMEISLWPEHDRSGMLAIYRGSLSAGSSLPAQVEIRIPATAGQPSAVAYVGDDGGRYNQDYSTRLEGEWLVVSFELAARGFQVEYYAPLDIDGSARTYEFNYVADYAAETLNLDVQVPPTAQSFSLQPAADSVIQQANGLTYHLAQVSPLEQGEGRTWTIAYEKADDALVQEPVVGQDQPATVEGSDNQAVLLFLVAFVGLFAVGAGAYWLGRRTQPPPPEQKRSKRRGSGRGPELPRQVISSYYCHQCGSALRSDSQFCHKCGTEVRES
jgi:hypothetical protein